MYTPDDAILANYANILVNYALGGGQGIKPGDVVALQVPVVATPLLPFLYQHVVTAGGHPLVTITMEETQKILFTHGSEEQITYSPTGYMKAKIKTIDHMLSIRATNDPQLLQDINPSAIMQRTVAHKYIKTAIDKKEDQGQFSRTVALYGTKAMAKNAGMSTKEYRHQIIQACFLDKKHPLKHYATVAGFVTTIKERLNSMDIETVHITGKHVDLNVRIGQERKRLGGGGKNIPSFEVFISPDWRGTSGYIGFDTPLFRYGKKIEDIQLVFTKGIVSKARASTHEDLLKEMIATDNADKIGEFSLTDKRCSRINSFMGETLYDENRGGKHGNTHIALGNAYRDSYTGDPSHVSNAQRKKMGYNTSIIHTDMIHTQDRTVVATLADGTTRKIYENGMFCIDLST